MTVFELMAVLMLDTSQYQKGLNSAEKNAKTGGNKIGSALKTAAKVGAAALTAATAAVVAFGKSSVDVGMEFDASVSQIAATLGENANKIVEYDGEAMTAVEALRLKAKQMGAETNFTATQAAEGLNILAMSGYDAVQSMDMIEDVLHLAAAGSMDMASAASYVSGAMKGFADETKDSTYYADLMAKGATLANTSVQQLGEAMSSGAAVASSYGQSAESMTLSLLRLAEQGEVGSAAGTALSAAMKNLYAPTAQAKKAMDELGISAYENGKALDFNDVVNNLSAALANYSEEEATAYAQTIFGIQGFNAYNKMVVTSTETQDEWAASLATATGEASRQYNTMTDNLKGDIDKLNSALDALKIAFSDKLTPSLRKFTQFGTDSISKLAKAFEEDGLAGALEALDEIINDGIELIFDYLPTVTEAGLSLLMSIITGIVDNLPKLVDAAFEIVKKLGEYLLNNVDKLVESAKTVVFTLVAYLKDNAAELAVAAIQIMLALVNGLIEAIPELMYAAPQIIGQLIIAILQMLPQIIETGARLIAAFYEGIIAKIAGVSEAARDIINAFKDGIINLGADAWTWGSDLMANFIEGIQAWFGNLVDNLSSIAQTIKNFLGFSEPKEGPLSNFHTYAPDMMKLFAQGIEDNEDLIADAFNDSLELGTATIQHNVAADQFGTTESPMTIIVQSVLDGKVIGETAYKYQRNKMRAMA